LEVIGKKWDFWYGLTLAYNEEFDSPNAPKEYKTSYGYPLGTWQGHQRQFYRNGELSPYKIKRLEAIGFMWNLRENTFERGFKETLKYKEQSGDPNSPNNYKTPGGYPLGTWQAHQRQFYKNGKLTPEKIKQLEGIGFKWQLKAIGKEAFEQRFQETLRYRKQFGNANSPQQYKTIEGFNLGSWQDFQRRKYREGRQPQENIKRLEEIGFKWNKFHAAFEKGLQETLKHKERFGDPNAPSSYYKTSDGYKLGRWQYLLKLKKDKLSPDQIRRLDEIGFIWDLWDIIDKAFEKGFL
jgi:hypothetical protein